MLAAAWVLLMVGGCAEDRGDLVSWMQEVRNTTPRMRVKVDEPKRFEPYEYAMLEQTDPFSKDKFEAAYERALAKPKNGVAPDMKRRREALESFPLEQIRLVGHLRDRRSNFALLQVEDMIYPARIGSHAGQNFGVITEISEKEVMLRELVQDAAGDWVERETSLRLQEKTK